MRKSEIGHRRYQTRLKPVTNWPPLTALIDLMFLLLIFFFLSGAFVRVSGIKVDLPRVPRTDVMDLEKFIITIAPDGRAPDGCLFYFNDRPVTLEGLKQQLSEVRGRMNGGSSATVVIRPGQGVPTERILDVMVIAAGAQLASFIATAPPGEKPETVFGQ